MQQKTQRPVQFEITEQTRESVAAWRDHARLTRDRFLFPSRMHDSPHLSTRQYSRLVGSWVSQIGLDPSVYGTHSLRRTKATLIYRRTKNLRAVRSNLTVRSDCLVDRLVFEGTEVVGVELAAEGTGEIEYGKRIVLSAGGIGSPAILLRSGLGPKRQIEALGIPLRVDLPGLGARLWDHAAVPIRLVPRRGECFIGRDPRFQVMARFSAPGSAVVDDMIFVLVSHLDLTPLPALQAEAGVPVVAMLLVALMAPRGHGQLTLSSTDPNVPPNIDLNFCTDAEDTRRLVDGMLLAWKVVCSQDMAQA